MEERRRTADCRRSHEVATRHPRIEDPEEASRRLIVGVTRDVRESKWKAEEPRRIAELEIRIIISIVNNCLPAQLLYPASTDVGVR